MPWPTSFRLLIAVALAAVALAVAGSGPAGADVTTDGYQPPVAAPVSDPFRPPAHRFGPGNRGIEYATRPGQLVVAAGDGVVAFAGPVGGRPVVSVDHADGLRTTYTGLADLAVRRGEPIRRGEPLGAASHRLHFGVRAGTAYLDPAALFAASGGPVRLVPIAHLLRSHASFPGRVVR